MNQVQCTAEYGSSREKIWGLITDRTDCSWRSDVEKCEVKGGGNTFFEYNKKKVCAECLVVLKIPHERYEFQFQRAQCKGKFTAAFRQFNGRTRVTFTLEADGKKAFLNNRLKKYLEGYIADLKAALGE